MTDRISLKDTITALKAAGEATRLRLLALLARGDLNVSDMIEILNQSQPRISRHLRLLSEAGLLERFQEGAWAYFRLRDDGAASAVAKCILETVDADDPVFARDMARLAEVRSRRQEKAKAFFDANAADWDQIRVLHVNEAQVEAAMKEIIGEASIQAMLDIGTGTGRLLELFAPICIRATGIDLNPDMLAFARANLDQAGYSRVSVRQGDLFDLPVAGGGFDLVTLHQVLHFLDDPEQAIAAAAKTLSPGGRLLVVDFAPHGLDQLRESQAHVRLGFSHEQMSAWLVGAGLEMLNSRDLPADQPSTGDENLTVSMWLARDPRILIA